MSSAGGTNHYVYSEFIRIGIGASAPVRIFTFTDTPPKKPDMLMAVPDAGTLTGALGQTTQIHVTATYADKTTGDVTPATAWTTYRTSNVAVATVSNNGLVTGTGPGIAYITAANEGTTAVAQTSVVPGDPSTSVRGFLRRQDGSAAVGAVVSIAGFGLAAIVAADGSLQRRDHCKRLRT